MRFGDKSYQIALGQNERQIRKSDLYTLCNPVGVGLQRPIGWPFEFSNGSYVTKKTYCEDTIIRKNYLALGLDLVLFIILGFISAKAVERIFVNNPPRT